MGQGVGQIVELAAIEQLWRHVVLEPENLGDLHLDAHAAADVLEQVVVRGVDLLGLLDRAVVQPQDDVTVVAVGVVEIGPRDADGLICVVAEDSQRTCGVKANALDGVDIDMGLLDDALYADADAIPDIGG